MLFYKTSKKDDKKINKNQKGNCFKIYSLQHALGCLHCMMVSFFIGVQITYKFTYNVKSTLRNLSLKVSKKRILIEFEVRTQSYQVILICQKSGLLSHMKSPENFKYPSRSVIAPE